MSIPYLLKYYEEYSEQERLEKDNQHKSEFLVSCAFINKYIKSGDSVLDVGAGTGIYSRYCAHAGTEVTAFDISAKNLSYLQESIQNTELEGKISSYEGNALDLTQFPDDTFDIVLNMGPLYHLKSWEEKQQTISECLRVLKPKGIIFAAYINKYFKYFQRISKGENPVNWEKVENIVSNGWKHEIDEAVFFFLSPNEAEMLFPKENGRILHHAYTDGISPMLKDPINAMNVSDFSRWMEYHLKFSEDPHLLGSSLHNLLVFQKSM